MKTKIVIVGEAYGENEDRLGFGFVGASGVLLLQLLDEVGIIEFTFADKNYIRDFWETRDPMPVAMVWNLHPEVHRTNVLNIHPPGNKLEALCGPRSGGVPGYPAMIKGKANGYLRAEFATELERLGDELVDHDPNLVIAMGNTPLWALTGGSAISKLRGAVCLSTHTATGFKVLPTYHPAAVLRQYDLRAVTSLDLAKAKREAEFPDLRRPKREIWIDPTLEDLYAFDNAYIRGAKLLSVDVETAGNQITRVGFAPKPDVALVIPFTDRRRFGRSYWPDAKSERSAKLFVRDVLSRPMPKKLFQNGLYDVAFFWRSEGTPVMGAEEDTMLLHHALQPESPKALGYLGSVYTDEVAWKTMRKVETIKRDE